MVVEPDLPTSVDVLVVGAGPTGLVLALELQRLGVDAQIVDRHAAPLPWDRATVIHPRALEIFEQLGVVDPILERGVRQRETVVAADGKLRDVIQIGVPGARYPFNLGLSEEVVEEVLEADVRAHGGRVHRGCTLVSIVQHADHSLARVECDGRPHEITARWVVGCDGFRGPTRAAAGIARERRRPDERWTVFDTSIEPWSSSQEATYAYVDEPLVLLTSLPDNRWRVYTQPESAVDVVAGALATVRAYHPQAHFVDVDEPSTFECHSMLAGTYRNGRIVIAGDAAHVCTPAHGNGMNAGVEDAHNLAWKLARVVHNTSAESLIDTYEFERRPIAKAIIDEVDSTEGDNVRPFSQSPLAIDAGGAGRPPGSVAPFDWVSPELQHRVVAVGPRSLTRHVAARGHDSSIPIEWAPAHTEDGDDLALYVVRPDGHIGLRADVDDDTAVRRYAAAVDAATWAAADPDA
ncbi:MAG: FAD-dependent monooxygenase [Actinomycetota bacterium]